MGGENRPHGPIFAFAAHFVTGRNGRSAELRANTLICGLGKVLGKPERVRSCAMFLVVFQPLAAVRDRGDVAGGNPPETITGLIHLFEPLGAVAKYLGVIRLVSEIAQRLDRFPDRHIDDHERIVVVGDVGGVARFRLEPPDKAGALSARALMGSSCATNSAIFGSSSGARRRDMLIWAR